MNGEGMPAKNILNAEMGGKAKKKGKFKVSR